MTTEATCHQCGEPLPGTAPDGERPRCLVQIAANIGAAMRHHTPGAAFDPPAPDELAARLGAEFEVLGLIGAGGMGAVYRARQARLDRIVAVKVLPPRRDGDPTFAERFLREARALARLHHPHVVSVYDAGEADGLLYIVMEYVDGASLRDLIADGRLSAAEVLRLIPQICDALQYAHDRGIVHRDIKPENVLVDADGRVKIADFGLAKFAGGGGDALQLTETRVRMGSPRYMAPEQRADTSAVDHRADLYSLGVMFYEMLTGELPTPDFQPPSQKAAVDRGLDRVLRRSLRDRPDERYQRAAEIKTDVERIGAALPWRRPTAAAALLLCVIGVAAVAGALAARAWWWNPGNRGGTTDARPATPPTAEEDARARARRAADQARRRLPPAPRPTGRSAGLLADSGQRLGGDAALAVALGDLDGDGDTDAFTAGYDCPSRVWLNDGKGLFVDSGQTIGGGQRGYAVALGDMDGDGDLDAIVSAVGGGADLSSRLWINDGHGRFADSGHEFGAINANDLALGDVDGDGDLDVVISGYGSALELWLNDGRGALDGPQAIHGPDQHTGIALGDLDGDGDADAAATTLGGGIVLLRNDGVGRFRPFADTIPLRGAASVALGDLDGDGDLDALVTITPSDEPLGDRVLLNDGKGGFRDTGQRLGARPSEAAVLADLDGDGDLDAVTLPGTWDAPGARLVWHNDGRGGFGAVPAQELPAQASLGAAAGDLNGDGRLDLFFPTHGVEPDEVWFNKADSTRPPSP